MGSLCGLWFGKYGCTGRAQVVLVGVACTRAASGHDHLAVS